MATENSSVETKLRAAALANQLGSYHQSIVIDTAVSAILNIFYQVTKLAPRFKVRGGSPRENLALQNIQVRKFFRKLFYKIRHHSVNRFIIISILVHNILRKALFENLNSYFLITLLYFPF